MLSPHAVETGRNDPTGSAMLCLGRLTVDPVSRYSGP